MVRGGSGAQTFRRRLAKAFAVFVGAVMVAPALGQFLPSQADACDPGRNGDSNHRWVGSDRTNANVTAVAAEILVLDAYVEDEASVAYTMLNDGQTEWAQVGTIVADWGAPFQGRLSFYQYTTAPNDYVTRDLPAQDIDDYSMFKTE